MFGSTDSGPYRANVASGGRLCVVLLLGIM